MKEQFIYPCSYCKKSFIDEWYLKKHLEVDHIDKLIIKVKNDPMPKIHQCSSCSRFFTCKWNLKRHMGRTHRKKITVREKYKSCLHCSEQFRTKRELRKHMKIHRIRRPFFDVKVICGHQCSHCEKRFTSTHSLKRHFELKHRKKVIAHRILKSCAHCSKGFMVKKELIQHAKRCPATSCEDELKETLPDGYTYNILESFKLSPKKPDVTWFFAVFEIPINYEELLIWMKKYEKKNLVRFRVKDYHKRERIRTYVCRLRYTRGRPKKESDCEASLRYIVRSDKIEVALKHTHNHHLCSFKTLEHLRPIYATKSEYCRLIEKGYTEAQIHFLFVRKIKKLHVDNFVANGDPKVPVSFYSASLDVHVSLPHVGISEADINKFSSELRRPSVLETNFVAENNRRLPSDEPHIATLDSDNRHKDFPETDCDSTNLISRSETSKEMIKFSPPIYEGNFAESDCNCEYILGLADSSEIIRLRDQVMEGCFQDADLISENIPSIPSNTEEQNRFIQYEPQLFQQSFLDAGFISNKTFVSSEAPDISSDSLEIYKRNCLETSCASDERNVMPDLSNITKFSGIIYQDNSVDSNFVFQESNIPLDVNAINEMSVNICQPNGEGNLISLETYDSHDFFDFNQFSTAIYQPNSQNECLILENSLLNTGANRENIRETDFIIDKNCSNINEVMGIINIQELNSASEKNCPLNDKLSNCSDINANQQKSRELNIISNPSFSELSEIANQLNPHEVNLVNQQICLDINKISDLEIQRNAQEVNFVSKRDRLDINKISDLENQRNRQAMNDVSEKICLDMNTITDVTNQRNFQETNFVSEKNCLDINTFPDVANQRSFQEINFVAEQHCSDSNKLTDDTNGQNFQDTNFAAEKKCVLSYPTDINHLDETGIIQAAGEFYGQNIKDKSAISANILTSSGLSHNFSNTLSSDVNQENWQLAYSVIENILTSSDVANHNEFMPNILREDDPDSSIVCPNISRSVAAAHMSEQPNVEGTTLITENVLHREKNKIRNCFEQMLNRITINNGSQYLPALDKFCQNSATLETDLMLCSAFYTFGDHS